MKLSSLLTLAAVGVGGYLLYNWISTPATAAAAPPAAPPASPPAPPTNPPATGGPPAIGTSSTTGSAVLSAMLAVAAASPTSTLNLDQWSYYAQQSTGLVVSPDLMQKIINAAGGDRSRLVTAAQWVQLYNFAMGTISGLAGYAAPYQCDGMAAFKRPGPLYTMDGMNGMGAVAVVRRAYQHPYTGRGHAYGRLGTRRLPVPMPPLPIEAQQRDGMAA